LDIPVMHDDQHGTAVVILAGLLNALKVTKKRIEQVRIVINGLGAAGMTCCRMLVAAGARHIVGRDGRRMPGYLCRLRAVRAERRE
jgi:malate dehydrogenase (oxaloacetate-decarboxylating)